MSLSLPQASAAKTASAEARIIALEADLSARSELHSQAHDELFRNLQAAEKMAQQLACEVASLKVATYIIGSVCSVVFCNAHTRCVCPQMLSNGFSRSRIARQQRIVK